MAALWETGKSSRIDAKMQRRILARLTSLEAAGVPDDMNLADYDYHALRGLHPTRYTVHINGPWCITFEFQNGDAFRVDFEAISLKRTKQGASP